MPSTELMSVGLSIITPTVTLNLNDHVSYAISGNSTRESITPTYNQIKASSPALEGEYLIHSTRGMITETVQVWVYGTTQAQVQGRFGALKAAFEEWSFQLAWTWADYSETWNCNAVASFTADMSQTLLHNYLASVTMQVPRFPTVQIP